MSWSVIGPFIKQLISCFRFISYSVFIFIFCPFVCLCDVEFFAKRSFGLTQDFGQKFDTLCFDDIHDIKKSSQGHKDINT